MVGVLLWESVFTSALTLIFFVASVKYSRKTFSSCAFARYLAKALLWFVVSKQHWVCKLYQSRTILYAKLKKGLSQSPCKCMEKQKGVGREWGGVERGTILNIFCFMMKITMELQLCLTQLKAKSPPMLWKCCEDRIRLALLLLPISGHPPCSAPHAGYHHESSPPCLERKLLCMWTPKHMY